MLTSEFFSDRHSGAGAFGMTLLPDSTDVFVIGGGPAGLAAALAARRRGFAVTLADCATPPIDKACGEGIMPDGLEAARTLGSTWNQPAGARFAALAFARAGRRPRPASPRGMGWACCARYCTA